MTALRGGNNGCKPSAAHPYPVVLVHATFADEGSNWVTLAPLLANNGYCVYGFNYGETILVAGCSAAHRRPRPHRTVGRRTAAAFVEQRAHQNRRRKVDLVGHSQGGMMPNYYLNFLGGASKVHTLIGLAPSNHGTTLGGLTKLRRKLPVRLADRSTRCSE